VFYFIISIRADVRPGHSGHVQLSSLRLYCFTLTDSNFSVNIWMRSDKIRDYQFPVIILQNYLFPFNNFTKFILKPHHHSSDGADKVRAEDSSGGWPC
jgi:hypothetical protein